MGARRRPLQQRIDDDETAARFMLTVGAAGSYDVYVVAFALAPGETGVTAKHNHWVVAPGPIAAPRTSPRCVYPWITRRLVYHDPVGGSLSDAFASI